MLRIVLILFVVAALAGGGLLLAWPTGSRKSPPDNPAKHLPRKLGHTDHTQLVQGTFADGPAVTKACLECHPTAAKEVMATAHWTWLGQEVQVPGHAKPQRIGKANLINNFCIGVAPNLAACTTCHAGYGWVDDKFDFSNQANVDCLICHDTSGTYRKGPAGLPGKEDKAKNLPAVDLALAARSVGVPTRRNCGLCHFAGGGGDAVKHGDLDGTMYNPTSRIDAHMGKHDLACQDCHRTGHHNIPGRSMSVSIDNANRASCTDCHVAGPHKDQRLNWHTSAVACQTCHVPHMAVQAATKMSWDWSTAGQRPDGDPHEYMKKKGSFTYAKNVAPEYAWYNGLAGRYLMGDRIDPAKVTRLNPPLGSIDDTAAKIWPFKIHRGSQIYDSVYSYFLVPSTAGKGGFWETFDWDSANKLGAAATGLPYSGKYGFAQTEMHWPLSHMVATADKALQCVDCHAADGRMDWKALGYDGDPAVRGGRSRTRAMVKEGK